MRIVDQEPGAVPMLERDDFGQRRQLADMP